MPRGAPVSGSALLPAHERVHTSSPLEIRSGHTTVLSHLLMVQFGLLLYLKITGLIPLHSKDYCGCLKELRFCINVQDTVTRSQSRVTLHSHSQIATMFNPRKSLSASNKSVFTHADRLPHWLSKRACCVWIISECGVQIPSKCAT